MNHIQNLDLAEQYYLKKTKSSFVLCGLTNVRILVYPVVGMLIGSTNSIKYTTELPEYIKKSKNIISLFTDNNNYNKP